MNQRLPPLCDNHRPFVLPYVQLAELGSERVSKGWKQRQCPDCLRWLWKDEWGTHKGWSVAVREGPPWPK